MIEDKAEQTLDTAPMAEAESEKLNVDVEQLESAAEAEEPKQEAEAVSGAVQEPAEDAVSEEPNEATEKITKGKKKPFKQEADNSSAGESSKAGGGKWLESDEVFEEPELEDDTEKQAESDKLYESLHPMALAACKRRLVGGILAIVCVLSLFFMPLFGFVSKDEFLQPVQSNGIHNYAEELIITLKNLFKTGFSKFRYNVDWVSVILNSAVWIFGGFVLTLSIKSIVAAVKVFDDPDGYTHFVVQRRKSKDRKLIVLLLFFIIFYLIDIIVAILVAEYRGFHMYWGATHYDMEAHMTLSLFTFILLGIIAVPFAARAKKFERRLLWKYKIHESANEQNITPNARFLKHYQKYLKGERRSSLLAIIMVSLIMLMPISNNSFVYPYIADIILSYFKVFIDISEGGLWDMSEDYISVVAMSIVLALSISMMVLSIKHLIRARRGFRDINAYAEQFMKEQRKAIPKNYVLRGFFSVIFLPFGALIDGIITPLANIFLVLMPLFWIDFFSIRNNSLYDSDLRFTDVSSVWVKGWENAIWILMAFITLAFAIIILVNSIIIKIRLAKMRNIARAGIEK